MLNGERKESNFYLTCSLDQLVNHYTLSDFNVGVLTSICSELQKVDGMGEDEISERVKKKRPTSVDEFQAAALLAKTKVAQQQFEVFSGGTSSSSGNAGGIPEGPGVGLQGLGPSLSSSSSSSSSSSFPSSKESFHAVSNINHFQEQNSTVRRSPIRDGTGSVGLVNPQNFCYLNSVLQQLYQCKAFKFTLFAYDCELRGINPKYPPCTLPPHVQGVEEFQRMWEGFVNLFLQMQFNQETHPSAEACLQKNFRDRDGNVVVPANASVPYPECINNTLEKLQTYATLTGSPQFIYDQFRVGLSFQIFCETEVKHLNSEKQVSFGLDLVMVDATSGKHYNNIIDSLQYMTCSSPVGVCEQCGNEGKNDIHLGRRVTIGDLPNTVFFNINRIDTTRGTKNLSQFTFLIDEVLDLTPYSSEYFVFLDTILTPKQKAGHFRDKQSQVDIFQQKYIDQFGEPKGYGFGRKYYQYRLVGAICHYGETIQTGHYTSIVRERFYEKGKKGDEGNTTYGKWIYFNDKQAEIIRTDEEFKKKCFGGPIPDEEKDPIVRHQHIYRSEEATVLVYERIHPIENKEKLEREQRTGKQEWSALVNDPPISYDINPNFRHFSLDSDCALSKPSEIREIVAQKWKEKFLKGDGRNVDIDV